MHKRWHVRVERWEDKTEHHVVETALEVHGNYEFYSMEQKNLFYQCRIAL